VNRPPKQPRRDAFSGEARAAYDELVRRFKPDAAPDDHVEAGGYFGALLNSPEMCAIASRFGLYFRGVGNSAGSYTHADREFVDQVLSAHWSTNVVQIQHIVDAARAGVRVDAIEALMAGRDDLLNDDERLLAAYIRQVVDGRVAQETYDRMQARLGLKGLVEYTGFILWLGWTMRMMQALDTGAATADEIKRDLARAREIESARDHG
jgi:hypothetical protein